MVSLTSILSPSGAVPEISTGCRLIVKNTFLDVIPSFQEYGTACAPRACSAPPSPLHRVCCSDALEPLCSPKRNDKSSLYIPATPSTTSEVSPRENIPGILTEDSSSDMTPSETDSDCLRTVLMLRNLPKTYTRDMLLETIDKFGFLGKYNFVYLPIAFASNQTFGYALLSFVTHAAAILFMSTFDGFEDWLVDHDKVAEVEWSNAQQGLEQLLERYRNSPVVGDEVPDDLKPAYFVDGVRIELPPPTKPLKALRGRGSKRSGRNRERKTGTRELPKGSLPSSLVDI